jgi:hypothetical protein
MPQVWQDHAGTSADGAAVQLQGRGLVRERLRFEELRIVFVGVGRIEAGGVKGNLQAGRCGFDPVGAFNACGSDAVLQLQFECEDIVERQELGCAEDQLHVCAITFPVR